jgi:hypothetical protein
MLTLVLWLALKSLIAQELPHTRRQVDRLQSVECSWTPPPLLSQLD